MSNTVNTTLSFDFVTKEAYDEVIEAMAMMNGYTSNVRNDKGQMVKNVEDKEAFAKRVLITTFKNTVAKYRANKASQEAIALAKKSVENFEIK